MDINTIQPSQFVDLFGGDKDEKLINPIAKFGGSEQRSVDLFGTSTGDTTTVPASTDDSTTIPSSGDTTTAAPSTGDTTTASVGDTTTKPDTDLFSDTTGKPGRKPKYDFSDISGYFEDRIKAGKFVAIEEDAEDGTKKPFIPKTPEEFDEVIDIQVGVKLDQERKDLEKKLYQSKSPAWQAVLKYSEMTDDPAEILPFIQGVRNIQSVAQIDEKTPEGAEQIVRSRLLQRGEQDDVITEQIEALKGADKLLSTAAKYKPLILNEEQQNLQALTQKRQQEEQEYQKLVSDIRNNAIKAIETPLFGKVKLKQEEKASIYDLIGEPDADTKGYGIYSVIDNLFDQRDFDTLRQVALLLTKKDAYISYISSTAADKTAGDLQKKLRAVTEKSSSSTNDQNIDDVNRPVVQRNQFKSTARFGR